MVDRGDLALAIYFTVEVGGTDLGGWTKCEGLGAEVVLEQREEGGNNGFVWQLPTRIKYTNIKLTRAVNADTKLIAKWFTDMGQGVERTTGRIEAQTGDGQKVLTYSLVGVFPVRWTGPSLTVESAKVATETLELAHNGFTVS